MNYWLKAKYYETKSKVLEKPYSYIFWYFLLLFFIPLLIWFAYFLGDSGFVLINTSLRVGEALGLYSSLLTFIGTVVLGALVLWQNIIFKKENDKSQNRIEQLANQANDISQQLLNMEKNKFRPYIRIDNKELFFTVSKDALGFSDATMERVNDCHIRFSGMAPFDDKNYEKCMSSYYPPSLLLTFWVENIGQAVISDFKFTRLLFLDGVTGSIESITITLDSSILNNEKKNVSIEISSRVEIPEDDDVKLNNKIYNKYVSTLKQSFRALQIELTIEYKDIYAREYWQEYSFHIQYDLDVENTNEYIMKITNFTVQHHVGRSPYGPRLDQTK